MISARIAAAARSSSARASPILAIQFQALVKPLKVGAAVPGGEVEDGFERLAEGLGEAGHVDVAVRSSSSGFGLSASSIIAPGLCRAV